MLVLCAPIKFNAFRENWLTNTNTNTNKHSKNNNNNKVREENTFFYVQTRNYILFFVLFKYVYKYV